VRGGRLRPPKLEPPLAQSRPLTNVYRIYTLYTVIKSFRHKGVEQFFRTGSKAKIQPHHADKLKLQLAALDNAKSDKDMNAPGWRLHPLRGDLQDHWSVDVSGNWRLTFTFDGEDAVLVDYRDYH
jgi:proteic killer suppression protein